MDPSNFNFSSCAPTCIQALLRSYKIATFYLTPSTEGVESTRGNSVCLCVCPSSLFPPISFHGLDHANHIFSESSTCWQPVPPCSDPVPPSTNQYCPILTQYHQIPASTALYWPSTIIYQCPSMSHDNCSSWQLFHATIFPLDNCSLRQ